MIDFIKIECLRVTPEFIQNTDLEFLTLTNCRTGEVHEKREATKEGLTFTILNSNVGLKGSLHNYFNKGLHNYNDFGYCDLIEVLKRLENIYQIRPDTQINSIEIGVNILVQKNPNLYLNSFVFHKGQPFTMESKKFKTFRNCTHQRFIIKVYDKGKQFKLGKNIHLLRFEIHISRMEHLKPFGINTLNDLKNLSKFKLLGNELLKIFDEITICDLDCKPGKLSQRDNDLFLNGQNTNFWSNLLPDSNDYPLKGNKDPEYRRKRKEYDRKLKRFNELLLIIGANKLKVELRKLIEMKINELTKIKRGKLTTFETEITEGNKKFCRITGIDITHQKKGSHFVSEKTVKQLFKNDFATFSELEKLYKGKKETGIKRFYFIAHNIRNKESNKNRGKLTTIKTPKTGVN